MEPNAGRLQTAEHILVRILENKLPDAKFIIAKFKENFGIMEIVSKEDLRKVDRAVLQDDVNAVIKKNLQVNTYLVNREDAEKEFSLARLPPSVRKVRIVEIDDFDRTPCRDPHVENTSEIGCFGILKVERVGRDRYRFVFEVT
jgi:misacylated tRNA(Ala) deacylase